MSRKTGSLGKKVFNIDIDSLLESEFIEEKDFELSPPDESWHQVKKSKTDETTNSKKDTQNAGAMSQKKVKKNEGDVFKFFECVGNDFSKSMQTKKSRLVQFTKKVSNIYQTKVGELVKKHEEEFEKFKNDVSKNVKEELMNFEDEFENIKKHEMKITKLLEQQFKLILKSAAAREERIKKLADLHQNILQEFEKLRSKQRTETLELSKSINAEISELQTNFLADFKNEELQTLKKHFDSYIF